MKEGMGSYIGFRSFEMDSQLFETHVEFYLVDMAVAIEAVQLPEDGAQRSEYSVALLEQNFSHLLKYKASKS